MKTHLQTKNLDFLLIVFIFFLFCSCQESKADEEIPDPILPSTAVTPIAVSKTYPKYFVTDKNETWIPIMINYLPYPIGNETDGDIPDFESVEDYFKKFSDNGGNAMRIWTSTYFLEIEDKQEGKYNPLKFERIDKLLKLAEKYQIRVKFTIQHIRHIDSGSSNWDNSPSLGTAFYNVAEYTNTVKGRTSYMKRVKALADHYKDNQQIFAWELWNEMNAVSWDDWANFTQEMLPAVKKFLPNHLVTQTLGSLDNYQAEDAYRQLCGYKTNEFLSIHRYLDPGTQWNQYSWVKGDIDTLVYSAVSFIQQYIQDRPIVVNEIGAVDGNHAGPSKYYKKDKEGILIHDMIFAPFFCGAAGSGSLWHWDSYLHDNNLWYHFKRFSRAIEGIDPVKEEMKNFTMETGGVRCYGLKGKTTTILWCRDAANNWQTELEQGVPAQPKKNWSISLGNELPNEYTSVRFYDPWTDTWTEGTIADGKVIIPSFTRSIVLVFNK